MTRVLDAPPMAVFRAWTDADRIRCWWGPKGYTSPVARSDPRVGGRYLYAMRSPEGFEAWSTGVYREVIEPERIVVTDSFSDADGNVVPASQYGLPGDWPAESLVTVTFERVDGKTKLTLQYEGIPAGRSREMAEAGWNQSFDKLAACLARSRPS